MQWIHSHCQIYGNEVANTLAKSGGRMEQVEQPASYLESKTLVKAAWRKPWEAEDPPYFHNIYNTHRLPGKQQRAIFRLRTGHVAFKAHLFKVGKANSLVCSRGFAKQKVERILQDCPNLEATRRNTWPIPNSLQEKLRGACAF